MITEKLVVGIILVVSGWLLATLAGSDEPQRCSPKQSVIYYYPDGREQAFHVVCK